MNHPEVSSTNHPSDETLAAFVDNRLDAPSRKIIIDHIATCDDCRADWQAISDFKAMSEERPDNVKRGNFDRGRWLPLSAIAAALALGFVVWPFVQTSRNRDALIEASAARKDRPSLARLSGEHPYKPPKATMRSGEDDATDPASFGVAAVGMQIEEAVARHRNVENLRQLAAVQILAERWNDAVVTAEEAVRLDADAEKITDAINASTNARLLTELSAAYFARASRSNDPNADYARSAESAKRAWTLSKAPEALWNYALAAERLGFREDARAAWQEYLKIDPSSPWAREAHQLLLQLDEQVRSEWAPRLLKDLRHFLFAAEQTNVRAFVARFPKESRQFAEEELLPEWGERPTASHFAAVRILAQTLRARGDRLLIDAVTAIENAGPAQRQRLATAHARYRTARVTLRDEPTRGLALYQELGRTFQEASSPFAALTDVRRAGCLDRMGAFNEALHTLETEVGPAEGLAARGYVSLAAQAAWMKGLVSAELMFPEAALRSYQQSLAWFRRLGEKPSEASIHGRAAQAADMMAERQLAFQHRLEGLVVAGQSPRSLDHLSLLMEATAALSAAGYANLAGTVADRLVATAFRSEAPDAICTALLWRSFHNSTNLDRIAALRDYDRAMPHCAAIKDPQLRMRIRENQAFVAGGLSSDGGMAMPRLNEAIDFAQRTGSRVRSALLFTQRSRLFLERKDFTSARADATRAVAEVSRQLRTVTAPQFRASLLDAAREVVGQQIDTELAAGDVAAAFRAAEWQRSTAAVASDAAASRAGPDDLRAVLHSDAAVLTFHVAAGRISIFAMNRSQVIARSVNLSNATLTRDVAALRLAIVRNDEREIAARALSLHGALIEPVRSVLDGARVVIVIPDGVLVSLPFALLRNREGQLLLDRHTLVTVPSAAMLLRRRSASATARQKTVIIGGAARTDENQLALTHAGREISKIASLYPDVQVIRNEQATPEAFLAAAAVADKLHYAGHAKTNELQPMLSALVLPAGNDGKPRLLSAREIAAKDWSGVRLVVLAGCSTGRRDAIARPFGSLTDTFFHAGVETVVGTLWDIEDETSRTASVRIHAAIRSGKTPAQAVRQVQLEMRNSTSPGQRAPRAWAAWTVMGGHDGSTAER